MSCETLRRPSMSKRTVRMNKKGNADHQENLFFSRHVPGMSPHSSSGGGGGTTPASASPIFVPIDLLHVWALSLLLGLGAGIMPASRLSPLEALRTVSSITKLSKYLYISETERMIQYITRLNKTSSMRQQGEATPIFGIS